MKNNIVLVLFAFLSIALIIFALGYPWSGENDQFHSSFWIEQNSYSHEYRAMWEWYGYSGYNFSDHWETEVLISSKDKETCLKAIEAKKAEIHESRRNGCWVKR